MLAATHTAGLNKSFLASYSVPVTTLDSSVSRRPPSPPTRPTLLSDKTHSTSLPPPPPPVRPPSHIHSARSRFARCRYSSPVTLPTCQPKRESARVSISRLLPRPRQTALWNSPTTPTQTRHLAPTLSRNPSRRVAIILCALGTPSKTERIAPSVA